MSWFSQLIAINDVGMTGAPFDFAMNAMIALEGPDVEFTFFRGTQAELKEVTGEMPYHHSPNFVHVSALLETRTRDYEQR